MHLVFTLTHFLTCKIWRKFLSKCQIFYLTLMTLVNDTKKLQIYHIKKNDIVSIWIHYKNLSSYDYQANNDICNCFLTLEVHSCEKLKTKLYSYLFWFVANEQLFHIITSYIHSFIGVFCQSWFNEKVNPFFLAYRLFIKYVCIWQHHHDSYIISNIILHLVPTQKSANLVSVFCIF